MKIVQKVKLAKFLEFNKKYCDEINNIQNNDDDICSLPLSRVNCLMYLVRYRYDTVTKKCVRFVYGGCEGNENNFETMEECVSRCE